MIHNFVALYVMKEFLYILKFVSSMMILNQFKEFRYSFLGLVYLLSLLPFIENSLWKLFLKLS